jgi:hypothetical protein
MPLITALCPYLHVASVDASLAFYALLGFSSSDALRSANGEAFWASARCGDARVMFARSSGPIDASVQAVLLYLYCDNVGALRTRLLEAGLTDLGRVGSRVDLPGGVYAIAHPHHMPSGELRVCDPDGYTLLIGQLH